MPSATEPATGLYQAIEFHKKGKLAEAKAIYTHLIRRDSKNHRLIYFLGLAEYQDGNYSRAKKYFKHAIALSSAFAVYYKDLGNCYKHLKAYEQAKANYTKALSIDPQYAEAHYDLGILYFVLEEIESAIKSFRNAVSFNAAYTDAHTNLALALEKKGDFKEAIICYQNALTLRPDDVLIYNNLGNAYRSYGKSAAAIAAYEKALVLNFQFSEAYCNLGMIYWEMGEFQQAIDGFEKAIRTKPQWEKPYLLLGKVYQEKGRHDTALSWFKKILAVNKDCVSAYIAQGQSYFEVKNEKNAISILKKALKIDSEHPSAYADLIKVMLYSCTWTGLKQYSGKLDELTRAAINSGMEVCETPFLNLVRHSDPKINFNTSRAYSAALRKRLRPLNFAFNFDERVFSDEKIHIAYLSNNFRNHPTANLLQDIFKLHDRTSFRVSCYSYGPDEQSDQRDRIKATCDAFIDLHYLNDMNAAQTIYDDQVDILIDLAVYLKESRPGIAAFHPAPLQARWLGMAGTTGADVYDYLFADQIVTPESEAVYYSENLIYLPQCYQINSNLGLKLQTSSKAQWDIPADHFVFCCFNAAYKIDPVIFKSWLAILKEVPKSVLWLMVESELAKENLKNFAGQNGVASERIIFAERLPREDHLMRLACVDLALDTGVVSGAATTSDALWAGVPVLTIKGKHFASRMSASILNAMGLSELVLDNLQDYQEKAIQMACDKTMLPAFKKRMARQRDISSLFDTQKGVKWLECAYRMILDRYKTGQKAQLLKVGE